MTQKTLSYVPSVEAVVDLPSPEAFVVGSAIYVVSLQALVATTGTTWVIVSGSSEGTVVAP